MSHFTVLVVTAEKPTHKILAEALQPFHEFECTGDNDQYVQDIDITEEIRKRMDDEKATLDDALSYHGLEDKIVEDESEADRNSKHQGGFAVVKDGKLVKAINRTNPNKKWDWWKIGGRWCGRIRLKDGAKENGIIGSKSLLDPEPYPVNRCDSARKGDIDFDTIRAEAEKEASAEWKKVRAIIDPHIEGYIPWEKVREEMFPGDIKKARDFYHDQPLKKAIVKAGTTDQSLRLFDVEPFLVTHDEYVRKASVSAFSAFAFLRGGHWAERGDMGWWGCISNEKEDWPDQFAKLLADVPDDHWLTIVDCHI